MPSAPPPTGLPSLMGVPGLGNGMPPPPQFGMHPPGMQMQGPPMMGLPPQMGMPPMPPPPPMMGYPPQMGMPPPPPNAGMHPPRKFLFFSSLLILIIPYFSDMGNMPWGNLPPPPMEPYMSMVPPPPPR